ncbi:MAG TPA: DUF4160 domain-containing protein [Bacteroidia bacterium]|nr:DUF4160 domain-containing protein [Bacteroidia bacterium]
MPVISMFYGIIVMMYFLDNKKHKFPHIHVKYNEFEAVFKIPEGEIIEGSLPKAKQKLVEAWIEIHHEELMADWELAVNGSQVFNIDPLK